MAPKLAPKRKEVGSSSSMAVVPASPTPVTIVHHTPAQYGFRLKNREHLLVFNQLKQKDWKSTRHLDFGLLEALGVREDIELITSRIGWESFLHLNEPTYKGLTLEFLSTLEAHILEGPDSREGKCTFQLGGKSWERNLNEINDIFGFPKAASAAVPKCESRAWWFKNTFWHEIADGPNYRPSDAKASFITNPAIRIFQRFMAHTIFGRGDGENNCPRRELVVLYAALKEEGEINSAGFLMGHLASVSHRGKGAIVIGGIVTKIARSLGISLDELTVDIESAPMDYSMFHSMRVLFRKYNDYYWSLSGSRKVVKHPDPDRMTISVARNWILREQRGDTSLPSVTNPRRVRARAIIQEEEEPEPTDQQQHEEEDEADDEDYEPDVPPTGYSDPRLDAVMGAIHDLRVHMDGRLDALNARLDAWEQRCPYPPPPPPPEM